MYIYIYVYVCIFTKKYIYNCKDMEINMFFTSFMVMYLQLKTYTYAKCMWGKEFDSFNISVVVEN